MNSRPRQLEGENKRLQQELKSSRQAAVKLQQTMQNQINDVPLIRATQNLPTTATTATTTATMTTTTMPR